MDDAAWPVDILGPPIWLELPDGSSVGARLLAWVHEVDGSWWAEAGLSLWSRVESEGRLTAEPLAVLLAMPAHLITKVEGVDYGGVPRRTVPKRRRAAVADDDRLWVIQQLPRGVNVPETGRIIHHADCWAGPKGAEPMTTAQTRQLLADGQARVCEACEASGLLPR